MIPKNTILVCIASVGLMTAESANAQHAWNDTGGWWNGHFAYDNNNAPLYNSQEVSLDLFASYINPEGKFGDLFETNIRLLSYPARRRGPRIYSPAGAEHES